MRRIQESLSIAGTIAALGGGLAEVPAAEAQPLNTTYDVTRVLPATLNPSLPTLSVDLPGTDGPYNGDFPASEISNNDVKSCQQAAVDNTGYYGEHYIAAESIRYKLGSRAVSINLDLTRLESWVGNEYLFSCAQITEDTINEQVVEKIEKKDHSGTVVRTVGNAIAIHGNESTTYDGNHYEISPFMSMSELPQKLSKIAVSKRNVGVEFTITSVPLIQAPTPETPGPMQTIRNQNIVWINRSQLAH